MRSTRQSYLQREIRAELRRFLTAARGLLVKTVALMAAVCAVPVVLHSHTYVTGLLQGVVLVATPAIVIAGFLLSGDSGLPIAGAYGESFTREEVAVAINRGYVHSAVPNIEPGPPPTSTTCSSPPPEPSPPSEQLEATQPFVSAGQAASFGRSRNCDLRKSG